jgi:hypothetical protein
MATDPVSKTKCYTPLSEPLKSIHFITLRTLKLIQTVTLLSIQDVPTVITIQIPVNFNVLLTYYPRILSLIQWASSYLIRVSQQRAVLEQITPLCGKNPCYRPYIAIEQKGLNICDVRG